MQPTKIELLSVAILGEMFRSNVYNAITPEEMSIAAVSFANFLLKSFKGIRNGN